MVDGKSLAEKNINLVHACCKRYTGKGIEYDDLFGAGCIGLVSAANRFDESLGYAFSTYAVPAILGEIKRLFRDGGSVKVSRSLKELSLKAEKERENLSKQLGREPKISELAKILNLSEAETAEALCVSCPSVSLSGIDEEKDFDLPVESKENEIIEKITIEKAMQCLDDKDKELIRLRYFGCKTQSETAKLLEMTQVQVSRKEKKILLELRKILT